MPTWSLSLIQLSSANLVSQECKLFDFSYEYAHRRNHLSRDGLDNLFYKNLIIPVHFLKMRISLASLRVQLVFLY